MVRTIGDQWVREPRLVALAVPSTVVSAERNYVLNPTHPDFDRVEIDGPFAPSIDS